MSSSAITLSVSLTLLLALVALARPVAAKPQRVMLPYTHCFTASSAKHSIPVVLLQAVVATESNWNPRARSHANAHGLMQIQWPGTAKHLGVRRISQLYKPCTNIDLGARYLRELLDRYDGDERRALAAYNYGPGRIAATGRIPQGADTYVATVRRHRSSLAGTQGVSGSTKKADVSQAVVSDAVTQKQRIATFTSHSRAERFADLLRRRVPRGTFSVSVAQVGRYELWLTEGFEALNADDRILLTSLGWRL